MRAVACVVMAIHSVFINIDVAVAGIFCVKRCNALFKHCGRHKGFENGAGNICIRHSKVSPLALHIFALLFRFFGCIGNFIELIRIFLISDFIRLVAIVIRQGGHCKHGARFAIHNNAVAALCRIFLKRSLKFFFKIILNRGVYR